MTSPSRRNRRITAWSTAILTSALGAGSLFAQAPRPGMDQPAPTTWQPYTPPVLKPAAPAVPAISVPDLPSPRPQPPLVQPPAPAAPPTAVPDTQINRATVGGLPTKGQLFRLDSDATLNDRILKDLTRPDKPRPTEPFPVATALVPADTK